MEEKAENVSFLDLAETVAIGIWGSGEAAARVGWALLKRLEQQPDHDPNRPLEASLLAPALADLIAGWVVEGWDRYGAPSVARHPTEEGLYVGSFDRPGDPYTVTASSKREAYRLARKEWVRRLLLE